MCPNHQSKRIFATSNVVSFFLTVTFPIEPTPSPHLLFFSSWVSWVATSDIRADWNYMIRTSLRTIALHLVFIFSLISILRIVHQSVVADTMRCGQLAWLGSAPARHIISHNCAARWRTVRTPFFHIFSVSFPVPLYTPIHLFFVD